MDRDDNYRLSHLRGSLANAAGTPFNSLEHSNKDWVLEKADFNFENLGDMSVSVGILCRLLVTLFILLSLGNKVIINTVSNLIKFKVLLLFSLYKDLSY